MTTDILKLPGITGIIMLITAALFLYACAKPEPVSFKADVGMSRKQVKKLLGDPLYRGGFVAAVDTAEDYTPQRDRFLLFYVYQDSSLIVFKHDTVFEIYSNVQSFKRRLATHAERRRARQKKEIF